MRTCTPLTGETFLVSLDPVGLSPGPQSHTQFPHSGAWRCVSGLVRQYSSCPHRDPEAIQEAEKGNATFGRAHVG